MFDTLNLSVEAGVAWLTFDHGKANEVNRSVLLELERLPGVLADMAVHTLVTRSERVSSRGTRIFVAGADVAERAGWTDTDVLAHVQWQRGVLRAIAAVPAFHIGIVDGVALGWGTEYLLTCDYRIAGPHAVFGLPETGLGIVPGAGGTEDLWRFIGPGHAMRLGMTGERIGPEEAHRIGLVEELAISQDVAVERAGELAARVATRSPTANAAFKKAIREARFGASGSEATAYEHCVTSGEAAIGRASFAAIRTGEVPAWGPLQRG